MVTAARMPVGFDTSDEAQRPPFDARELRSLCFDLLGRPPLAGERARWAGRPRAELIAEIVASEDAWRNWVDEQLYYFLLVNNFAPRTEGALSLPGELARGVLDVRTALHRIALTPTFDARNPGADTFVTVVMEQLAGLDVKRNSRELEIGKRIYDGGEGTFLGAKGNSQSDVVANAIQSKLFVRHLLAREHERLTRAKPDPKALAAWAAAFETDAQSYAGIVREWLLSDVYEARLAARASLPNRLFVRALFVDIAGRVPSEKEVEPMREALDALSDPTPLRAFLARTLAESPKLKLAERADVRDPGAWVEERFAALLGRAPTAAERAAFVGAFDDPGCRPRTILTALVTSAEYQEF